MFGLWFERSIHPGFVYSNVLLGSQYTIESFAFYHGSQSKCLCWIWVGDASQVQICADIVGNLHLKWLIHLWNDFQPVLRNRHSLLFHFVDWFSDSIFCRILLVTRWINFCCSKLSVFMLKQQKISPMMLVVSLEVASDWNRIKWGRSSTFMSDFWSEEFGDRRWLKIKTSVEPDWPYAN